MASFRPTLSGNRCFKRPVAMCVALVVLICADMFHVINFYVLKFHVFNFDVKLICPYHHILIIPSPII